MTKGIWRKQTINDIEVAVPVGADSVEALRSYKDGHEFVADTHGARNLEQLKLFWALVGLVTEATDQPKEVVKRSIAIRLGFVDTWVDLNGGTHVEAASISCEKMTQAVFRDFFNNAVNVIAEWLDTSPRAVRERFNDMTADKRYNDARR